MKTTLELPDSLIRRVKAIAGRRGQSIATFITSAVEAKLAADEVAAREKPWMKFAGVLQDEPVETNLVLRKIEEACEKITPEEWK